MSHVRYQKPDQSEYANFYHRYIDLTPEADVVYTLGEQLRETLDFMRSLELDPDQPYAPGKWSLKQVLGHLIDTERVFSYRALSFARADGSALPGMDQNDFQNNSDANARQLEVMFMEWTFLRQANVLMFESFTEEAWLRSGIASGAEVSVRALAHMIAGHELHHLNILRSL